MPFESFLEGKIEGKFSKSEIKGTVPLFPLKRKEHLKKQNMHGTASLKKTDFPTDMCAQTVLRCIVHAQISLSR